MARALLDGLHPALALVPIVPFLPHEPRRRDLVRRPPDDDAVHHAEHEWNGVVQVVLFLFGLVNAGVILRGYDTGTWAVLTAALSAGRSASSPPSDWRRRSGSTCRGASAGASWS